MKAFAVCLSAIIPLLVLEGCTDDAAGGGGAIVTNDVGVVTSGLDLSGAWSGRYTSPSQTVPLKVRIRQSGNTIIIQTNKEGVGHLLTGTVGTSGNLVLTDSLDGETWTSYGAVTDNNMIIRDYLYVPSLGSDSPEQDIFLSR